MPLDRVRLPSQHASSCKFLEVFPITRKRRIASRSQRRKEVKEAKGISGDGQDGVRSKVPRRDQGWAAGVGGARPRIRHRNQGRRVRLEGGTADKGSDAAILPRSYFLKSEIDRVASLPTNGKKTISTVRYPLKLFHGFAIS